MCWPPIGWSFVRGKTQIAMVVGRVCRVVVGEGTFIQRRHSVNEKTVVKSGWSFVRGSTVYIILSQKTLVSVAIVCHFCYFNLM